MSSLPTHLYTGLENSTSARNKFPLHFLTTSFVGREKELENIKSNITKTRQLTLVGPSGMGKTRLMLQFAENGIDEFPDGVWLVENPSQNDHSLSAVRIAAALGVQEQPCRTLLDTLTDYLRRKELLLLLDNFGHTKRESAKLTQHLLDHCPNLYILVTGCEPLIFEGENTLQIPSLSLLDSQGEPTLESVRASESAQLFSKRAQTIHPDFNITRKNATPIAGIVLRLDGIPLALELAAAHLRENMTVEKIATRLQEHFSLLTGGRKAPLPRQQTQQILIYWIWNQLVDNERRLLQRLAIFSDGCTLEAALAVTSDDKLDEVAIPYYLDQLISKSLMFIEHPNEGDARYGMHESIREYALQRLAEADESETTLYRYADYYLAFSVEAELHLNSSELFLWEERIKLELNNIRSVLVWSSEHLPQLVLRICSSFLYPNAHWLHPSEARKWLEPAIEKTWSLMESEGTNVCIEYLIKGMTCLGIAYFQQENNAAAYEIFETSIRLARVAGETRLHAFGIAMKTVLIKFNVTPEWMQEIEEAIVVSRINAYNFELAWLLVIMFRVLSLQEKSDLAMRNFYEVIEINTELNSPRINADILSLQAHVAKTQGNITTAKEFHKQAMENYEAMNDRSNMLMSQSEMAHIMRQAGDFREAELIYRQSIIGWQEQGLLPAVAHQLECFAFITIVRGQYEHAAKLLGTAMETRKRLNAVSTDPEEIIDLKQAMAQLDEALGEDVREIVMAEGRMMNLDDAVTLALNGS